MRGFSSSFPRRGAGAGLLLLRLAVGLQLLFESSCAGSVPWWWLMVVTALALMLLVGVLTPLVGTLCALCQLLCLATAASLPAVLAVMTAVALVLLGPGAYALDARWFGRRRLVLPASPAEHDNFSS